MTLPTHKQPATPRSSGSFRAQAVILGLVLLLVAAHPQVGSDLKVIYSPDITARLGGVTVHDHELVEDDLGLVTPVGPTDVPPAAEVDGLHDLGSGHFLLSFSTSVELSGIGGTFVARANDVVEYNPYDGYTVYQRGADLGIPQDTNVDALTLSDTGNNSASATLDIATDAEVSINKTAHVAVADPNDFIEYTLHVVNNGPSHAAAVKVTDALPGNATLTSVSPGGSVAGGVVSCVVGTPAAGASADYTIRVRVSNNATSAIVNNAAVESDTPDPNLSNNVDDATTALDGETGLGPGQFISPTSAAPGDTLTKQMTVSNVGPGAATEGDFLTI